MARQALSMAQQEKNQLMEKLNNSQRELANASMEMDRLKRDAFTKQEQDRVREGARRTGGQSRVQGGLAASLGPVRSRLVAPPN